MRWGKSREYSRGLHDDCDTTGFDGFLDSDCDLFGESLLDLKTATESFCDACQFRKAQHELIGNIGYSDLRIVDRGCCGSLEGYAPFL